jgi:hypothetical protein
LIAGDANGGDGALMEPSGRNRWQPLAKALTPKTAQTGRSATGVAAPGNGSKNHGKEEVDGSSPSEGSAKTPEIHVSLF